MPPPNETIIEEIRQASRVGFHAGSPSIVDTLMASRWCDENDLQLAYSVVTAEHLDLVIVFFQLPFVVRLPSKWISIPSDFGNPFVYFRTVGTLLNRIDPDEQFHFENRSKYSEFETFTNAYLPNDAYGQLIRTQVLVSYQLWGSRLAQYSMYLQRLEDPKEFRAQKLYPAKGVFSRNPLTAATYEIDLSKRLYLQTIQVLKQFIPSYAMSCVAGFARAPEKLDNYFIMVKTGRIVATGPKTSILADVARPFKFQSYAGNLSVLKKRLDRGRQPSIYETYLLEAAKQVEMGASNLAVVQTVMVLDLFANEIISSRLLRKISRSLEEFPNLARLTIERIWESRKDKRIHPSTYDKFIKYLPAIGLTLPDHAQQSLNDVIKLRNRIVHRIQANPIDPEEAKRCISVGLFIMQHSMDGLLTKQNADRATEMSVEG